MKFDLKETIRGDKSACGRGFFNFLTTAVLTMCFCFTGVIPARADAIYLIDSQGGTGGKGALLSIDAAGHRTMITDFGATIKVGGTLKQPKGQFPSLGAVEANGNIVLVLAQAGTNKQSAVIRVDPMTGTRTLLSDLGNPAQGPAFPKGVDGSYADGLAVAADGTIYMNPGDLPSSQCSDGFSCWVTLKVDPVTGRRTFIADWGPAPGNVDVPEILAPFSDGSLLVSYFDTLVSNTTGIVRLDPQSGDHSNVVTNFGSITNHVFGAAAIVQDSANTILVFDPDVDQILRVDVITGQRAVVSDFRNAAEGIVLQPGDSSIADTEVQPITLANSPVGTYILATGLATRINKAGKSVASAVVAKVDPVTGNRTVFSDLGDLAEGPTTSTSLGGIMFYGTPPPPPPPPTPTPTPTPTVHSGDLITTNISSRSLVKLDPVSGQPTVLSDFTNAGQGPIGYPWAAVANSTGTAYATQGDASQVAVFAINTVTGSRTILSNFTDASQGPTAQTPRGLAVEGNGNLLVTDRSNPGGGNTPGLFEVNALTGARTRLSDFNNPALGPVGGSPMGVALDASGFVLVVDALAGTDCHGFGGCGALFRVDRSTGTRTMISDFGNPAQGPLGGTGPNAMAIDADGSVLVLDNFAGPTGLGQLFRVNPTTGLRTIVTDYADATQGTVGSVSIDSGVAVVNGIIFAPCAEGTCKIDPVTGHRTPFSVLEGSLAVVP